MGKELESKVTQTAVKKEPEIFGQLRNLEADFGQALPKGLEAQQLIRDAITAIRLNTDLLRCSPPSIFGALMTAAQLGLRPNVLGQCYVIPYGTKAQFIVGYQGLVELAHRSGRVLSIVARTVYENDYFELEYNVDKDVMVHKPTLDGDPGKPRFYYARATLTDGGYQMTNPMTHTQMEAFRRKYSKAKSSPWDTEFEAMAHKTVIRQLIKLLPKSIELGVAVAADDSLRLHKPGQTVAPLSDVPNEVTYVDSETVDAEPAAQADRQTAGDYTERRQDALLLRDKIFACDAANILAGLVAGGERARLLDIEVPNEHGDDEELRLIAERKRTELVG